MTMLTQQDKASDGQLEQVTRVAVDAVRKAVADYFTQRKPSKDSAQRLHANGNKIVADLREKLFAMYDDLAVADKYKDEEARSNYVYPKEYRGQKSIGVQVDILAKEFGLSLGYTSEWIEKVMPRISLPDGAEGWFAIPSIDAVAKRHFPEVTDPALKYCRAVELILEKLGKPRNFYNYHEGEITPQQLRQHVRTSKAFERITETQKGDILIVPVQYGMRHRGRSIRRARECFGTNEFGLGAFAIGTMALTHPERYVWWERLPTDCAGDEFAPDADGDFSKSPLFSFHSGGLRFDARYVSYASERCGSVSGFLPQ
jgi:hypothetical protein